MTFHVLMAAVGAVLLLLGIVTFGARPRPGAVPSRWYSRPLVGVGDTAFGVALILYGVASHQLWALVISLAGFVLGVICGISVLIKALHGRVNDEFGSA